MKNQCLPSSRPKNPMCNDASGKQQHAECASNNTKHLETRNYKSTAAPVRPCPNGVTQDTAARRAAPKPRPHGSLKSGVWNSY